LGVLPAVRARARYHPRQTRGLAILAGHGSRVRSYSVKRRRKLELSLTKFGAGRRYIDYLALVNYLRAPALVCRLYAAAAAPRQGPSSRCTTCRYEGCQGDSADQRMDMEWP
jgi:hypothetical protein